MKSRECNLIQELLPLYAEKLVSSETAQYIEEHLATCNKCTTEWNNFTMPLPDPLTIDAGPDRYDDSRLIGRLKRTIAGMVLCLVLGGAGLAYASFTAGRHIGMDDPVYRFAQELNLFTDIQQTKNVDEILVTVDKGLFDSTRSVLFLSTSDEVATIPQVILTDNTGEHYEQRRGKGWNNKYFMLEFEPASLDTKELTLSLVLDEADEAQPTVFTFPVDVVKTAQYTKIIYPNQKVERDDLKITLDKVVLGVSESECRVRIDWPVDGSVVGLGIGRGNAYFPTSVVEAEGVSSPGGLRPGYAARFLVNYHSKDLPVNRPALYDLTETQEIQALGAEYSTTQFPCQVEAVLKFAPAGQESEQFELLLPPIYLYKEVASPKLYLSFQGREELDLNTNVAFPQGEIIIDKAWMDNNILYLSYFMEPETSFEDVLPHFQLTDGDGEEQGRMHFDLENPQLIIFSLFAEETDEFILELDSVGQLLPREKFVLDLEDNKI